MLYLASQSSVRQELLNDSEIPFVLCSHTSDEQRKFSGSYQTYIQELAQDKMSAVVLPEPIAFGMPLYILTADTLVYHEQTETMLGKPRDRDDALRMLTFLGEHEVTVTTACCIEKRIYEGSEYKLD